MLKMGSIIPILGCLISLACATAGYIIGENTPVWIASRSNAANSTIYEMQDREIVKKAIDTWKARPPFDFSNTKTRRYNVPTDVNPNNGTDPRPDVATPVHVLVAMDYPSSWPTRKQDEEKYIVEKILRAVAFWYGIHQRLKHVKSARYEIHIAGIIIGRDKLATPYTHSEVKDGILGIERAAIRSLGYWEPISDTSDVFPFDSYHVIATMTELQVNEADVGWFAIHEDRLRPLKHGGVAYSLVYSDRLDRGLEEFELTNLANTVRGWSTSAFKRYPHLSPGIPIKVVPLPGQIISLNKQCEAYHFWKNGKNRVCFKGRSTPCIDFECMNFASWRVCEPATKYSLDGSFCYNQAVCLRGSCVPTSTIKY